MQTCTQAQALSDIGVALTGLRSHRFILNHINLPKDRGEEIQAWTSLFLIKLII